MSPSDHEDENDPDGPYAFKRRKSCQYYAVSIHVVYYLYVNVLFEGGYPKIPLVFIVSWIFGFPLFEKKSPIILLAAMKDILSWSR